MGIDCRILLEQQRERLHNLNRSGLDYSETSRHTCSIGRLLLTGPECQATRTHEHSEGSIGEQTAEKCPKILPKQQDPTPPLADLKQLRREVDPFTDPSLLDQAHKEQELKIRKGVET